MAKPTPGQRPIPIQPVENPILCPPYEEPTEHWWYDTETGEAQRLQGRRPASYWFKTQRVATQQLGMFAEEQREELPLVNALRQDVKRWRNLNYEGATEITKEFLRYWRREDRTARRLFFCQLEAAETIIFLNEILLSGKRTRFRPAFEDEYLEKLRDIPADPTLPPVTRLGIKMATGSGKTVVMAMLIAWAFCNRGKVPSDERFPSAALVVCPNLTIKERLRVLRPEHPDNYYEAFDLVPSRLCPLLQQGKVLVTNWHLFAPESEHSDGGRSYRVVNKGPEGPQAFARRVLGDLYDRGAVMVLNDEGHHAWRPKSAIPEGALSREEKARLKGELATATVWVSGLDTINQAVGIRFCVDLSATPFYIQGSGYVEGSPFPWLVGDFGLVDAIESGIVKIPRLPVSDTTGRPEPRYFRLWQHITDNLQPAERLPGRGRRPKPEIVFREAQPALNTLAGQWVERFKYVQEATNEKDKTPPALIVVCANTDIAEVFYRHISGEQEIEVDDTDDGRGRRRRKRKRKKTVYSRGDVFPEYFSNTDDFRPTVRIDSKLLAEAETGDPTVSKSEAAEQLRKIVSTVGVPGAPGEQVRCVVSVAMLNEGWDAHNVTNILGLRAFDSQLLCEQVVGRGLRRMDYTPDPETGLLTEEYVDIYGVPFSLIPFKGRPTQRTETGDRPKNHVRALLERADYEIRFPVVEGYAFALRRNVITADIDQIEPLRIEPEYEPTAVFVKPRVGYQIGMLTMEGPGEFEEQTREAFYASTHPQTIEFEIARQIAGQLAELATAGKSNGGGRLPLQSRHQLFPQVLRIVHAYTSRRVNLRGVHPCELGLQRYVQRIIDLLLAAIRPDEAEGEPPLMPILNRYVPSGSTESVDFKTTKSRFSTTYSHINLVAADTATWEQSAAFRLEQAVLAGTVQFYARNDQLGFTIPYDFMGVSHAYEPDYLVRLCNGDTLILEIKGMETEQDKGKHQGAKRWVSAVSNWGKLGRWRFHVNRDPQMLGRELRYLVGHGGN